LTVLRSLEDTRQLASRIIATTRPGSLLLLEGPLGAGKTALVTLLARELGSTAAVSSPTYTLIHEYPTPQGLLVHIDAYRLPDVQALLELGFDEYLDRSRLVAVEWGAQLHGLYPEAMLLEMTLEPTGLRTATFRSADDN
jgi:tRNA threonylcarbamoyladenosine biosynthesis protein TsaE